MKFILRSIIIIFLFIYSFLAFLPKEGFYNFLEQELIERGVIVSGETLKEKTFGIKVTGAEIYYEGLNTALFKSLDLDTYLFYTSAKLKDLRVSKDLANMLPSKILNVNVEHSVLNIIAANISANGDFGSFEGKIHLLDRKITGELKPSNIMKSKYRNLLREFKLVEGKYLYEYRF